MSLIFAMRRKGRDFLRELDSHHRSPTDTLPDSYLPNSYYSSGRQMISVGIIYNKGRKHS